MNSATRKAYDLRCPRMPWTPHGPPKGLVGAAVLAEGPGAWPSVAGAKRQGGGDSGALAGEGGGEA
eukprot:4368419-Alexandrium_andersonii.AAC.1